MSSPVEVLLPVLLVPARVTTSREIRVEQHQQVCDWDELSYEIRVPDMTGNREEAIKRLLLAKGWTEVTGKLVKEIAGVKAVFDPATMKATAAIKDDVIVKEVREKSVEYAVDVASVLAPFVKLAQEASAAAQEKKVRDEAKASLDQKAGQARAEMRQNIEARLTEADKSLRKEMQETVVEYYAEGVKERAKSMGEIVHLHEEWDDRREEYALTLEIQERA